MIIGLFGTLMSQIVVRAGVNVVVLNAVRATTPVVVSNLERVLIGVGGFGISTLLGEAVVNSLEKTFGVVGVKFTHPKPKELKPAEEVK